ncbi:S1 domain-containing RNA-binding protein [Lacticaseibacillus thailandensis]|uniref:S1 motif domain-containing protein n=1 Tax=Lacticaseibacillus thailandensis DSM 22698 = JCM 13996 TaxID=1423810 RepID=A0A0R2C643_9LACO|nr:S1 domain-containing RNA-binding protein [Lacticaseibacillus thailandensis]KRM86645.1 hypothetical protein FD19_GL001837 [Lacticaseibacillus thailandensis DSM 22698 = JCM 13996]
MSVAVGAQLSGKVTGITKFGAFVDLGDGQTGLVHISEVADTFVQDVHDFVSVGDTVNVKVLSVDGNKIGLSIRKASGNEALATEHAATIKQEAERHHEHERAHGDGGRPHVGHGAPHNGGGRNVAGRGGRPAGHHEHGGKEGFDDLLSDFLKESEQRLSTIRRNTEGKRGGRGGRRS